MKKYDLIVIGIGPAGMVAVGMGTKLGLSVLGVEMNSIGGECLNVGCIPSKAMLKIAQMKYNTEILNDFGLKLNGDVQVVNPLETVREHVASQTGEVLNKMFSKADLLLEKGPATFVDEHTVEVDGIKYHGDLIFIATGTEPVIPPIEGLSDVPYVTNVNVFNLTEIPSLLTIIGGGAIGVEMAQAFSRLGSKVTIVHMDEHLVPSEDSEAAAILEESFKKEGIVFYNGEKIISVSKESDGFTTKTTAGTFVSDQLLVATGRKPSLASLNLDAAGVSYDKKHINVDEFNRTNIPHIYAVGDINGKWLLTHAAMHQAMLSLMQAMSKKEPIKLNRSNYVVPRAIFTNPEIAQVGLNESEAKKEGIDFFVVKKTYDTYARAVTTGASVGFVKVITDDDGTIFGATIVGEQASEMISEWTLAMQHNLKMMDIVMTQHAFPSLSLLNRNVAEKWMMIQVTKGNLGSLMG
ncbi:MAG: pyridine nucleotide-disulfide oxidoreductase [Firmicutes bacterium HGW-Firmicutes-10]|nr:MAG: pyridine nucleotide-disulfide oxidoreductase [Firmicutes bacterium HGW-Firmicutes-10]